MTIKSFTILLSAVADGGAILVARRRDSNKYILATPFYLITDITASKIIA